MYVITENGRIISLLLEYDDENRIKEKSLIRSGDLYLSDFSEAYSYHRYDTGNAVRILSDPKKIEWEHLFGNIRIKCMNNRNRGSDDSSYLLEKCKMWNKEPDYGLYSSIIKNSDENARKLYEAFIDEKIGAVFSRNADRGEKKKHQSIFVDGVAYTLNEIIQRVAENNEENLKYMRTDYQYIDCGVDGYRELLVKVFFAENIGESDDEYELNIVIKNVNGELKICYFGGFGPEQLTNIFYNGEILAVTSCDTVNQMHSGEQAYIDKDGHYNFWYAWSVRKIDNINESEVPLPALDGKYCVRDITRSYVEPGDSNIFHFFLVVDRDGNIITDNPQDENNPYNYVRREYYNHGYHVGTEYFLEKMGRRILDSRGLLWGTIPGHWEEYQ